MSIQYCKPCNIPHVVLIVLILSIYTCSNLHAYPSKAFIYTFTLIFLLRPLIFLPHFNPSFYISRTTQRNFFNMQSLKVLLLLAMLMALAITLSATLVEEELFFNEKTKGANNHETFDDYLPMGDKSQEKTSLRGSSSVFLASRAVTTSSCDKNPKVCRAATNSPRSHCCNNKCVDVKTDRLNCGKCGVKCNQAEICCNGHVVHTMSDKKHCGTCDNHCKRGGSCAFGMCSYA